MIKLIQGTDGFRYVSEMSALFRLRAKVFKERLDWDVVVAEGMERDAFDELNPLYLLSYDDAGVLRGTVRLLPTLGPNMLSDVFRSLLPQNQEVRSASIWECSRFAVDHEVLNVKRSGRTINVTTAELLLGMTEVGVEAGLKFIVAVVDMHMERVLKRAECHCDRIGPPKLFGKVYAVAGLWETNEKMLRNLQKASGISGSVVDRGDIYRLREAA